MDGRLSAVAEGEYSDSGDSGLSLWVYNTHGME
jgi:hypothetical protein